MRSPRSRSPRLADDNDASGAHEEAVRNLDIDFPAELAAIDAQPFDADLVWNRMNKGPDPRRGSRRRSATTGAAKHGGLKKKDLVTAAAESVPPRSRARRRRRRGQRCGGCRPGSRPVRDDTETLPEEKPDVTPGSPTPALPTKANGNGVSDESSDGATAGSPVSGNGASETPADDGSLPAFLTS